MESDLSSTSVMKTRPSDSVTLIKLLELVFVVVSAVEMMVDVGELRARDGGSDGQAGLRKE